MNPIAPDAIIKILEKMDERLNGQNPLRDWIEQQSEYIQKCQKYLRLSQLNMREALDSTRAVKVRQLVRSTEALISETFPELEPLMTPSKEEIQATFKQLVDEGMVTPTGDSYSLTLMGQARAKFMVENDPETRDFYRKLLESFGKQPDDIN